MGANKRGILPPFKTIKSKVKKREEIEITFNNKFDIPDERQEYILRNGSIL